MIAQQWTEKLFGAMGTTQTGSGGGFFSSLFSSFLGGGGSFANGTTNAPGGFSWVGEKGPEKVYLPKGSQVVPNHQTERGGNRVNNINISVDGQTTRQTAQQIAQEVRGALAFAGRAD
jgi:phage-related tail protein